MCPVATIELLEQGIKHRDDRIASLEAENKSLKQCDTEDQAKFKAMVMFAARLTQALNVPLETSPSEMIEKIVSLKAERDKLKESISHFSGLLGEETQKRYALEAERDTASHNAEHYANLCIKAEAERDMAVYLLREAIAVMRNQEKRESGEFHWHADSFRPVWDTAVTNGESFLARIGGEGKNG